MTGHDALTAAKALILESGWTQNVSARDANGRMTYWGGPEAVCFCMDGALCRVAMPGTVAYEEACRSLYKATDSSGCDWSWVDWNDRDGRTLAEVLEAFDRAIEATR